MARDVVLHLSLHAPRQLRLPAQPLPPDVPADAVQRCIFDDVGNEARFHALAERSYAPAIALLADLAHGGACFALGVSAAYIQHAARWEPALLQQLCALVAEPHVELVCEDPCGGLLCLLDLPLFVQTMRGAAAQLERIFGKRPRVAATTGYSLSPAICAALTAAGFDAAFADGRPHLLGWREPSYLYRHDFQPSFAQRYARKQSSTLALLVRHTRLSEDVTDRLADATWDAYPLRADRYADWIARATGDQIVLGWPLATLGGTLAAETGIFDFLAALPGELARRDVRLLRPQDALAAAHDQAYALPFPDAPVTGFGNGSLDALLGTQAQRSIFAQMQQALGLARLTASPLLLDLALWLTQVDALLPLAPPDFPYADEILYGERLQVYANAINAFTTALCAHTPSCR